MDNTMKNALTARNIVFSELPAGDLFFRRIDGQGMYVRRNEDGSYDWSVNAARNDTNLMDFRSTEKHALSEVLRRIDEFLSGIVSGRLVVDTLGLVQQAMQLGMTREEAERAVVASRDFILDMHKAGSDAHEIKRRFAGIHAQLKDERLERETNEMPVQ